MIFLIAPPQNDTLSTFKLHPNHYLSFPVWTPLLNSLSLKPPPSPSKFTTRPDKNPDVRRAALNASFQARFISGNIRRYFRLRGDIRRKKWSGACGQGLLRSSYTRDRDDAFLRQMGRLMRKWRGAPGPAVGISGVEIAACSGWICEGDFGSVDSDGAGESCVDDWWAVDVAGAERLLWFEINCR